MNFTFNTDSLDGRNSLVKNYQNLSALTGVAFTIGEKPSVGLLLANASGYDASYAGATVSATLGQPGGLPVAISFPTWTAATNGWTGTLDLTGDILAQMFSANQTYLELILEFSFALAGKIFKRSTPVVIYASNSILTSLDSMTGLFSIGNGVSTGSVTGLNLAIAPRKVVATVLTPAGGFVMSVVVDNSTITADGFTFNLSGVTDSANYKLSYILNF